MKKAKKHDVMYAAYGYNGKHLCRECCNFIMVSAGARMVSKCRAYGITSSSATDWNGRKTACGMFGKDILRDIDGNMIKLSKHRKNVTDISCEGQIEL